MALVREFLGWHRPGLASAVDWLEQRYARGNIFDLGNVKIALPGARAGRRLLELLVERAEAKSLVLEPPHILTVGWLPECLYKPSLPLASSLARQWAWVVALTQADPDKLVRLFFQRPGEHDWSRWLALADMLDELHTELAGEGLDFNDLVLHRDEEAEAFIDAARWQELASLQSSFLDRCLVAGFADTQTERLRAIHEQICQADFDIVLVGAADATHALRKMLDQVADRVTALVIAPMEMQERFDAYGCLKVEDWQNVPLDLRTDQVRMAGGPADQAAAALGRIAAWQGRYAAEDITIAVADRQLVPFVEQKLAEAEIPSRYVDGLPMAQTGPYRLLEAVADYLETGSFAEFAALVRHPDVETRLAARLDDEEELGAESGEWLSELDRYYRDRLPVTLNAQSFNGSRRRTLIERVFRKVDGWLKPLRAGPQLLARWPQAILNLLLNVYGHREWDRNHPDERAVLETCEAIRKGLEEQRETCAFFSPEVSAAEAIRLTLRQIDGNIPPLPDKAAIELLGWLELPLDDASALIVTGFNDGMIPASVNAHSFLPNALRRRLGLLDNDRRYARDAYALSVLLASKQEVSLISGRRTSSNDPLLPSRLMFACDGPIVVERVEAFFHPTGEGTAENVASGVLTSLIAGQQESKFIVPRPLKLTEPVTQLRVTEFKSYLSCPYRYYLRHRLGLNSLDDSAEELDPGDFGSLVHDVLRDFGRGPGAAATDLETIRSLLNETLDQWIVDRYGNDRLAAISVQIEQVRARLRAFAQWQAERSSQGWRIEHTERKVDGEQAPLEVDGQALFLLARIDRIDVHDATGRRMIFDYKTSDNAKSPDKTHRCKNGWIDLQLPLYEHIARQLGMEGEIQLGYINLSKDLTKVNASLAEWGEADLQEAMETARQVVRDIRAGKFWPLASPPPDFSKDLSAICQDGQFGGRMLSGPEEGEE